MKESSAFRQISKDGFLAFKKVRQLSNSLYGSYSLYSKTGHKYICKTLPKEYSSFKSYRNSVYHILRYTAAQEVYYLFPLHGEPLVNFMHKIGQENQLKRWVERHQGSVEACLVEIVKKLVKLVDQKGLTEIVLDGLRVHNGEIEYCYDTWMRPAHEIVYQNPNELQNYFLGPQDLTQLCSNVDNPRQIPTFLPPTKNTLYYRIFLLILCLGTSSLKDRNYQYGLYQLNKQNIQNRLNYFSSLYKNLGELTRKVLQEKPYTMEELWKIVMPQISKQRKSIKVSRSNKTSYRTQKSIGGFGKNKENLDHSYSQIGRLNTSFASEISIKDNDQDSSSIYLEKSGLSRKKSGLKLRDENLSHSKSKKDVFNSCKTQPNLIDQKLKTFQKQQRKTYKIGPPRKQFDLHHLLLNSPPIPSSSPSLLSFLSLSEHIPYNSFEQSLLSCLASIHVKITWSKQLLQNGSIYLGETQEDRKEGKGLYVFGGSGDFYWGDWKEDQMEGYGVYGFSNGEVYEGDIRKGAKEGFGTCRYEDGREYQGHWKQNQKVGLGKVKFPNDVTFIGVFNPASSQTQGLFLGPLAPSNFPLWQNKGILQSYNWQKNTIQPSNSSSSLSKKHKLKSCLSQFYSQMKHNDGSTYEGEVVDGKKEGFGIYENSKQRYQGQWKDNKRDGEGVLYVKEEFAIAGKWKDNIMVQYAFDQSELLLL